MCDSMFICFSIIVQVSDQSKFERCIVSWKLLSKATNTSSVEELLQGKQLWELCLVISGNELQLSAFHPIATVLCSMS